MTGRFVRTRGRYYHINMLGQVFSTTGMALLCTMTQDRPAWAPFVFLGLTGIGYGGAFATRLIGILTSVDDDKQIVIQAASWTIDPIGLALGIIVASTVFQNISCWRPPRTPSGAASSFRRSPKEHRSLAASQQPREKHFHRCVYESFERRILCCTGRDGPCCSKRLHHEAHSADGQPSNRDYGDRVVRQGWRGLDREVAGSTDLNGSHSPKIGS